MYYVEKHYPHSLGLSAAFRQWKATDSHCRFIHGYALAFTLSFEAETLDHRNWVVNFGGLKNVKKFLEQCFDHKLCYSNDDPHKPLYILMDEAGVADVHCMDAVGCEAFAKIVFEFVERELIDMEAPNGVRIAKVMCHEHPGNAAGFGPLG